MSSSTEDVSIPALSEGTTAAVKNLIDYAIEAEYGHDTKDVTAGAEKIAIGGLMLDLRDDYLARTGGDDTHLRGYVDSTLRILIRDGLAARECQIRQLDPSALPCHTHYEADVPEVNGARLCGPHYIERAPSE